jgi:hypothetical protein
VILAAEGRDGASKNAQTILYKLKLFNNFILFEPNGHWLRTELIFCEMDRLSTDL